MYIIAQLIKNNICSMNDTEPKKNRVLEFAENHPYILLAVIFVLIILIIVIYFINHRTESSQRRKSCKKKDPLDSEEEMDDLIESIHAKQRKKKNA